MKADIDFENGTITLVCSKCRRKYPKRISEIGSGLRVRCKCKAIITWRGDLSWVSCCARRYQWDAATVSLRGAQK
jgi:hypothetical protein